MIPVGINGVAPFTTSGVRGLTFRANDTQVKQLRFNNGEKGEWTFRDSQDGGTTWSAWITIWDSNNHPSTGEGGSGYVLPIASPDTLGGVKPDGKTITISDSGIIVSETWLPALAAMAVSPYCYEIGRMNYATSLRLYVSYNLHQSGGDHSDTFYFSVHVPQNISPETPVTHDMPVTIPFNLFWAIDPEHGSINLYIKGTVQYPYSHSYTVKYQDPVGTFTPTGVTATEPATIYPINYGNSTLHATDTRPGIVMPDGVTITAVDGVISAKGTTSDPYTLPVATPTVLGGVKPDNTTIKADATGKISATQPTPYALPVATTSTLGGIKPDGTTIKADADGTLHATATGSGGIPDNLTQLNFTPGTPDSTIHNDNLKINFGQNISGKEPGYGGDLSLLLYDGGGTGYFDVGMGVTSGGFLNIKNGRGAINFWAEGTVKAAQISGSGLTTVLHKGDEYTAPNAVATHTRQIGIKMLQWDANNMGFEFRFSDTIVKQMKMDSTNGTGMKVRFTRNNGAHWTDWTA